MSATELKPTLAVEGLGVRYRGGPPVLDGVSFAVEEGEVYALLGRNGAGKTSLVRCLLGLQRPDGGGCRLFGRDAWRQRERVLADVGIVPEEPDAPAGMTAAALGRFAGRLHPGFSAGAFLDRLTRFGVPAGVPFGRLSRGQRAQVMLALALAPSPRLLVLDDPTLGLDAVARRAFLEELVGELAERGVTVFVTSHDLPGLEAIADRVAFLVGGRLVVDEALEGLKGRFRRLLHRSAGGPEPAVGAMTPVRSADHGPLVATTVAAFDAAGWAGLMADGRGVEAGSLSLEEIFVAVAGDTPGGRS